MRNKYNVETMNDVRELFTILFKNKTKCVCLDIGNNSIRDLNSINMIASEFFYYSEDTIEENGIKKLKFVLDKSTIL